MLTESRNYCCYICDIYSWSMCRNWLWQLVFKILS